MLKELALFAALLAMSAAASPKAPHDSVVQTDNEETAVLEDVDEETNDAMAQDLLDYMAVMNDAEKTDAANQLLNYMSYAYLTPTGVKEIDEVYATRKLSCKLCTKAVKFALPRIKKRGCSFLFKLQAIAVCNAIGLGPGNPLTSVCSGVLIGSCKVILKQITKHITDPAQICNAIRLC